MQRGSKKLIDEHVSGIAVTRITCCYALFLLDMTGHSQLSRTCGSHAGEVRLYRTGNQDCVGMLRTCRAQIKLKLACFVTTEGQARAVISLDEQLGAATMFSENRHGLERSPA